MDKRPDERFEQFHLWTNTDRDRRVPEGFPVVIVLASAAVTVVLALIYILRAAL